MTLGDLKERHRRRCEKSINKVPTTRKRSCQSCIASKVNAVTLTHTAGSRCRNRQIRCEYKLDIPTHPSRRSTTASVPTPSDPARLLMAGESMAGDTFDSQLWFTEDLTGLAPDKTGL
ncbi:fungal zn(2)-Cys(6) binuclear cluster domain-containing protein [Penicillium odoratum]|uniref:fungal zn(2)-Cys(6) binuclear cluster domain-containing protein n=1 Tax=Penicillium odoratum TaxID=1167516 RepID=UPI00254727E4|nr:fungal zn(2)-Cys(6) binuclear cluster domain-containing protein [Penicillium odoratum]KAJ5759695.1 fungal zn(2)-Cys(6) binuclear cluster domain-containing protein [Penicillium odoratum]